MKVSQSTLNQWRTMADRMRRSANGLKMALANADRQRATELNGNILTTLLEMSVSMDQSGAQKTDQLPQRYEIQAHNLTSDANRRLLAALEAATVAWQEVDLERGYKDDGPSQMIDAMRQHVHEEVNGYGAEATAAEELAASEEALAAV